MKNQSMQPQVLVVGTIGIDTIITPFGRADEILGGSATYFALACRLTARPAIVAVAGTDLPQSHKKVFTRAHIDTQALEIAEGKTFAWAGEYHADLNTRTTLKTELNLLETFSPKIPESLRNTPYIFLANLQPDTQLSVLKQMNKPQLVGLDTMNFWIERTKPALLKVLKRTDIFVINDEEARLLAKTANILKCAQVIQKTQKPGSALIVKRGEFGLLCFYKKHILSLPGYPLETVIDPTGAGDSFAGALMGELARKKILSLETLKTACAVGSTTASFTVERFGTKALEKLTLQKVG
ncbi:MAG TPA: PfkB family carbohydrate kinase, partial [Patescibacteria group bacterium]|nr:PfkB family carbohydrate kinase [Patescibacteria group bacterium]